MYLGLKRSPDYSSRHLRFLQGVGRNRGNLRRAAYCAGITRPFVLSKEDVTARLNLCQEYCSYFREHGRHFRRRYLKKRAAKAQEDGNEDAEKEILGIIKRENERAFWR